jgi:hypothetical protein
MIGIFFRKKRYFENSGLSGRTPVFGREGKKGSSEEENRNEARSQESIGGKRR